MDSDKELKIKITTAADTSGLKQISDALKDVSDAAQKDLPFTGDAASAREFPGGNEAGDIAREPRGEFPAVALQPALNSLADAAKLLFLAANAVNEQLSGLNPQPSAMDNSLAFDKAVPASALGWPGQPAEETSPAAASTPPPSGLANYAAESLQLGRKINSEQSALLNSLASLLQLTLGSTRDMLDLVRQGRQDHAALQNEIGQLKRSVANLASARGNPGNPTPP